MHLTLLILFIFILCLHVSTCPLSLVCYIYFFSLSRVWNLNVPTSCPSSSFLAKKRAWVRGCECECATERRLSRKEHRIWERDWYCSYLFFIDFAKADRSSVLFIFLQKAAEMDTNRHKIVYSKKQARKLRV